MKIQLKPVRDQVIVITGATSGIGLATAKQAAKRGASVVLNARAEEDLQIVAQEINEIGSQVAYAAGDVADIEAVRNLAVCESLGQQAKDFDFTRSQFLGWLLRFGLRNQ